MAVTVSTGKLMVLLLQFLPPFLLSFLSSTDILKLKQTVNGA